MKQVVNEIRELLEKTGITQAALVRMMNGKLPYTVTDAEFNRALKSYVNRPKVNRMLADAYSILSKELKKQEKANA